MKKRVLIVDDNRDFRENVQEILESQGYAARSASDGETALELVKREEFDVILLDVRLSAMGGLELYKKLKELSPHSRMILMTACMEDWLEDALSEGAFGVFLKTIEVKRLLEAMGEFDFPRGVALLIMEDLASGSGIETELEEKGFRVHRASTAKDGLDKIQDEEFDLVVIDVPAPSSGGSGSSEGYRVRMAFANPRFSPGDDITQVYPCITKPVDINSLISIIGRFNS